MLQSQTASASDVKQSQEEKDRAFAEQLHNELNCEFPCCPPDGSASLGEDDLYADNGFHLYEDSQLVRSNDEVIAAILQTDAIVPDSRPIIVDRKTDLAIALELQQAEMGALCLSDSHIANEIANQEMNTGHDSVLAREIADEELGNQLQGDEKMAQHLSQAESQYSEQHELPAMSDACSFGMTDPPPVQYNHNHQQHQHHWRQRRGGMQGHRAGHDQHEEVEGDNYEDLLELEERIGDAEGQGLNPNQLSMLPVSKYTSSSSEDNECKVCFSKFELDDTVRTLPCCHLFHRDCIDNWIKDHNSCPICRKGIREELHH